MPAKNTIFSAWTFGYINVNSRTIKDVADLLGVSASAIAGGIANEYNIRTTYPLSEEQGLLIQTAADFVVGAYSHAAIKNNYIKFANLTDQVIYKEGYKGFVKLLNPALVDLGPGNIQLRTAIRLIEKYSSSYSDDPLGLKKYNNDYSKLAYDLIDQNNSVTVKISGLMAQEAQELFSKELHNWDSMSAAERDAAIVTYYKRGKDTVESLVNEARTNGLEFKIDLKNPVYGGSLHLLNADLLREAIDNAPAILKNCFPSGTLVLMADGTELPIEQVRPGDLVAAFDPQTELGRGDLVPKRVLNVFTGTTKELMHFKLSNGGAISLTPGHKILAACGAFRRADDVADFSKRVVFRDGGVLEFTVEKNIYTEETARLYEETFRRRSILGNSVDIPVIKDLGWKTYNFEVEDLHTYVANGVRVHNDSVTQYLPEGATALYYGYDTRGFARDMIYVRADKAIVFLDGTNDKKGNTIKVEEKVVYPPNSEIGDGATIRQIIKYDSKGNETSRDVDYFEYDGKTIQLETIGNILGSQLGAVLGGNTLAGRVVASTLIGTLAQNLAEALQKSIKLARTNLATGDALPKALEYAFKDFGQDLKGNLAGQITGQISALLMTELADALNLKGFERGLFTSVGTTITNQVLHNVQEIVLGEKAANASTLFEGFSPGQLFGQVAGAVGGYLGSYLASQILPADNPQASIGTSIGSSIGAYIGSFIPVPVLGTFIGAFFGDLLGTALGNAVGVDQKSWGSVSISAAEHQAIAGGFGAKNEGEWNTFTNITTTQANMVNRIVDMTGARIIGTNGRGNGTVAYWQKGKTYTVFMPDGSAYDFVSRITRDPDAAWAEVADDGIMQLLRNVKLQGGNIMETKAFENSKAENSSAFAADIQVAKSYYKYIQDAEKINLLIKEAPKSSFAMGWVLTLMRAKELGLDKIRELVQYGDDGGNVLKGTTLIDKMWGRGGNDNLNGKSGNDILYGEGGNDVIRGDVGNDTLYGGAGSDRLYGGAGKDVLNGGDGNDDLRGGSEQDVLAGGTGDDTLSGGDDGDSLYGEAGRDALRGNDGDDTLYGGIGDDTLYGGAGNDSLSGEGWDDELFGEAGDDTLSGGEGYDRLYGGAGNDHLDGGTQGDILDGGAGDDTLSGGSEGDELYGGNGNDVLDGGSGFDRLFGDAGDDRLDGGAGSDELYGGDGDDTLKGGADHDLLVGGAGADWLVGSTGRDDLRGGDGNDHLQGDEDDDTVAGGSGNDTLLGGDGSDRLRGDDGDDTLQGEDGRDDLDGGEGNDLLYGGAGNDALLGSGGDDTLYGGAGHDGLSGDGGNDELYGEAGDDVLKGGAGADLLLGAVGADTLYGGAGTDSLSGAEGNDHLYGDADADSLDGGTGDDKLWGGDGQDTLDGGDGNDVLTGDAGDDTLRGGLGDDMLSGGAGNDSLDGGGGRDQLFGGDGNDILIGGPEVDFIDGGEGTDTLVLTGLHSDYKIRFNDAIGRFSIVDLRAGSPDGTDLAAIELFQFSDGTFTKAELDYVIGTDQDIAWDVADSDGSKSTLGWRPWSADPAQFEIFVQRRTIANVLMSETVFHPDGSRLAYAWDVNGAESWASYVQTYDTQARLIRQQYENDDTTRLIEEWDHDGAQPWSHRQTWSMDIAGVYEDYHQIDTLHEPDPDPSTVDVIERLRDPANQAVWDVIVREYDVYSPNSDHWLTEDTTYDGGSRILKGKDYALDTKNYGSPAAPYARDEWQNFEERYDTSGRKYYEAYTYYGATVTDQTHTIIKEWDYNGQDWADSTLYIAGVDRKVWKEISYDTNPTYSKIRWDWHYTAGDWSEQVTYWNKAAQDVWQEQIWRNDDGTVDRGKVLQKDWTTAVTWQRYEYDYRHDAGHITQERILYDNNTYAVVYHDLDKQYSDYSVKTVTYTSEAQTTRLSERIVLDAPNARGATLTSWMWDVTNADPDWARLYTEYQPDPSAPDQFRRVYQMQYFSMSSDKEHYQRLWDYGAAKSWQYSVELFDKQGVSYARNFQMDDDTWKTEDYDTGSEKWETITQYLLADKATRWKKITFFDDLHVVTEKWDVDHSQSWKYYYTRKEHESDQKNTWEWYIDDQDVAHYVIGDANGPADKIPDPPPHADPDVGFSSLIIDGKVLNAFTPDAHVL